MSTSLLRKWRMLLPITLVIGGAAYLLLTQLSVSAVQLPPVTQTHIATPSQSQASLLEVEGALRMEIKDAQIVLPVKDGEYDPVSKTWSLDNTHAFLMKGSATPLLYGHAIPTIFEPLEKVRIGSVLKLKTIRGVLLFAYEKDEFVAPNDTVVLNRYIPDTILLMTCEGWFSEQRRVLHFKLVSGGERV